MDEDTRAAREVSMDYVTRVTLPTEKRIEAMKAAGLFAIGAGLEAIAVAITKMSDR